MIGLGQLHEYHGSQPPVFVKFTILYILLYFYYFLLVNFNLLCIDNHVIRKINYDDYDDQ